MARYAAFLRGVNLGGHRRVSNERLRAVFEKVGNERVTTFRASGNVIFDPKAETSPDAIRSALERGLADSLGFGVTVFLRSANSLCSSGLCALIPTTPAPSRLNSARLSR